MAAPTYFRNVDLDAHIAPLGPLEKEGRIYVAPLANGPLVIQTPLLEIQSLGESHAWTRPTGPFKDFLARTERLVQRASEEAAVAWGITQEQVTTSFKSFFRDDGSFKVRVGSDFTAFTDAGDALDLEDASVTMDGVTVRAALELSRVCLGKTEVGAIWRLVQIRLSPPPPPCLIDIDAEVPDDAEDPEDEQKGDEEFL